jgi:hypothetical protein
MKAEFTGWTEANLKRLGEMKAEGKSARQIAEAFGWPCSRNAVLGVLYRNFHAPDKASPKPEKVTREPRAKVEVPVPKPRPIRPEDFIAPALPVPGGEPLSITELTESTCRWIAADPKDERPYCGKRKAWGPSHPYCEEHQLRAETPKATFIRRSAA